MSKRVLFCKGRLVTNGKVVMPAIGKKMGGDNIVSIIKENACYCIGKGMG